MSKNNKKRGAKQRAIDVEATPVAENKPTVEKGNYIIEIISNGEILRKMAVAGAEINITKLSDGGLTVDLK